LNEHKIKPNKAPGVNYKVLGVSNEIGIFLNEKLQAEETNQSYFVVAKNEFCYNPYRINVGSIGLNTFDYDNQIISGAYVVFATKEDELSSKYLDALFNSKGFLAYVNDKANGAVRMNMKFEDMEAWEIPLPAIEEQNTIISQIEKQKIIIEGSEKVLKNWEVDLKYFNDFKEVTLESLFREPLKNGVNFTKEQMGLGCSVVNIKDLYTSQYVAISNLDLVNISNKEIENNKLEDGDILFVRSSVKKEGVGCSAVFKNIGKPIVFSGFIIRARVNKDVLPEYLNLFLKTIKARNHILKDLQPVSISNINQQRIESILVPLPEIEVQRNIVRQIETHMKVLEGLNKIKDDASIKINQILADVWGIEFVEPIIEEVADEQEN